MQILTDKEDMQRAHGSRSEGCNEDQTDKGEQCTRVQDEVKPARQFLQDGSYPSLSLLIRLLCLGMQLRWRETHQQQAEYRDEEGQRIDTDGDSRSDREVERRCNDWAKRQNESNRGHTDGCGLCLLLLRDDDLPESYGSRTEENRSHCDQKRGGIDRRQAHESWSEEREQCHKGQEDVRHDHGTTAIPTVHEDASDRA